MSNQKKNWFSFFLGGMKSYPLFFGGYNKPWNFRILRKTMGKPMDFHLQPSQLRKVWERNPTVQGLRNRVRFQVRQTSLITLFFLVKMATKVVATQAFFIFTSTWQAEFFSFGLDGAAHSRFSDSEPRAWYFHLYVGKWSKLTHIFQRGWNHQLATVHRYIDTILFE